MLFPSLLYPIRSAATVEESAKARIDGLILVFESYGIKEENCQFKLKRMLQFVTKRAITLR